MKKIENGCQDKLDWFDGKHINEILFCQEFLKTHPMRCIGGTYLRWMAQWKVRSWSNVKSSIWCKAA